MSEIEIVDEHGKNAWRLSAFCTVPHTRFPCLTEAKPRLARETRNVKGRSPNHTEFGAPLATCRKEYHQRHGFLRVLARDLTSRLRTCLSTNISHVGSAPLSIIHRYAYTPLQSCNLSLSARLAWRIRRRCPANLWRKLTFHAHGGTLLEHTHKTRKWV